ncbi:urease accessory protein UreD [Dactylosporangium sp. CA-092794]|uniref:urease accessory protein UreD n=1 Tax=Dactylosporangium sp. CA-092794 TaxID=3239929 RepID=UPI003D8AF4F5
MRAAARVVAERDGERTALRVLKGEAPLLPRRTGPNEVHFVGGAAGPLGGDDLSVEIEVGPGAVLWVRTVAASIALPGRDGAESRLSVHATVADGGRLAWLPEPTVAAARCRHHTVSSAELSAGAGLVWREEVVFGRHGEAPGDIRLSTTIRRDSRPWYRSDVAVGPSHPGGPAILDGARVLSTLIATHAPTDTWAITDKYDKSGLVPSPDLSDISYTHQTAAIMALAGGGFVATALADELAQTRRVTDRLAGPAQ